jgi:NADH:flavin oxidoreductase / NADH oxidase family
VHGLRRVSVYRNSPILTTGRCGRALIPVIIEDHRNAVRRATEAGFDGVEVYSANCYLLEQFIRDSTNKRMDRYGGSVENRTRLPVEVSRPSPRSGAWVRLSPTTRAVGDTPTLQLPWLHQRCHAKRVRPRGISQDRQLVGASSHLPAYRQNFNLT